MRRWLIAAALAVALCAPARQAAAQEEERGSWYGWQIVVADAAAAGLLFAPIHGKDLELGARGVGMTLLFMDAPIIHMAHRNARSASYSLLRVPGVVIGRLVASLIAGALCGDRTACEDNAHAIGSGVGFAPVFVFDVLSAFSQPEWRF